MNIWIINQYAMPPKYEVRIRNNAMAKYLQKMGYNVKIISASTIHNSNINLMSKSDPPILEKTYDGINFVNIKTSNYSGNGFSRFRNHSQFLLRLLLNFNKIKTTPNIIICNLGIPFTLVAYLVSKLTKAKFIFEVRDLWPESFVAYNLISKKNPFLNFLYEIEKWVYKKSDKLVFSMEGGRDYIIQHQWDQKNGGPVNLNKVHYINNGVDLDVFNYNKNTFKLTDYDLENTETFKVIYTGSIRQVNNVKVIVDSAQKLLNSGFNNIQFLIYGDGSEKEGLEIFCKENNIHNVKFKGHVDKKYIPYILSKSDLNIVHFNKNILTRYGVSMNKLFDYFASGKPTISDCEFGYDLINTYNAGVSKNMSDPEEISKCIISFYNLTADEYQSYCNNALR